MPKDVVTLSTFCLQAKWKADKDGVKKFIDGQIENIKTMKNSFDAAAKESGREPPEMVLSALMIPQWKSGNEYTEQDYNAPNYLEVRQEYFEYLKEQCETAGIKVQDFYSETATEDEKKYLDKLEALGSAADLIKNRAIINNLGNRHLQIDTNTIVVDRNAFYKETFGADAQKDGMNASYYDVSGLYVSPHNKVVYSCETSEFTKNLAILHNKYVQDSKDDLGRKTPGSNQVYSKGFCNAALDSGLVTLDRKYNHVLMRLKNYYPVKLEHPTFQMSKHIITAINMSWSQGEGIVDYCAALKGIVVPITSGIGETTTLDFQSFSYLIKKYTNFNLPPEEREKLLAISDENYDVQAINEFVGAVIKQQNCSLLGPILRSIPNTMEGKVIREQLFETFKNNPDFLETIRNATIIDKVTPEDLDEIVRFIPEDSGLDAEKSNLVIQSKELLEKRLIELENMLPALKEELYTRIKVKLDTLGPPYIVTEADKNTISKVVDTMIEDGVMDRTIEQFQQVAQTTALNKVLNDRLKMQPKIKAALENIDLNIQHHVAMKIYKPPINEKFNKVEINSMVQQIVSDINVLVAAPVKQKFFENADVKEFINTLNSLAAIRPMNTEREAQIDRMSDALVKAITSITQKSDITDMSKFLQSNYEGLQLKYPTQPSYSDVVSIDKRLELLAKDSFNISSTQIMKEHLQTLKKNDLSENQSTIILTSL